MIPSERPPFLLTPLDNVVFRIFVPIILFFPNLPGSSVSKTVDTLRDGLSKTLETIVPLSGTVQVINQRGELAVTGPWMTVDDILCVNDLRQDGKLEYQTLKDNNFSLETLDKEILLPLAKLKKQPVMQVQLNLINGGMIMAFCTHHSFTDGNGAAAIAKVWGAYCRGEDGSKLVTPETLNRDRLTQGWGTASLADFPTFLRVRDEEKGPTNGILATKSPSKALPEFQCGTFFFSKGKLAELKRMASLSEREEKKEAWISTNDALCALLGCCAHAAIDKDTRAIHGSTFTVGMILGGRRMLDPPLPANFIGNIIMRIGVSGPIQRIESTPAKVAEMAYDFRDQIKQRDERDIRKFIAALSAVEDFTTVEISPPLPSEHRLIITSWANQDFCGINWGDAVGPRIERVRYFLENNNRCIILPELRGPSFTDEECGLEAMIGLEKRQLERLKHDKLFMRFAQLRCD